MAIYAVLAAVVAKWALRSPALWLVAFFVVEQRLPSELSVLCKLSWSVGELQALSPTPPLQPLVPFRFDCTSTIHPPSTYTPRLGRHCKLFPECCWGDQGYNLLLQHEDPVFRCLADADGNWATDFIGRVEHLDEDMRTLVNLINERRPAGTQPLKYHKTVEANVQSCDGSK